MNDPMNLSAQHLSETELESFLIGDAAPAAAAHLSGCEPCRLALAEMEAPLASFRAVTLAWSERRSATLPLNDLAVAQSRAAAGWRQRLAVSAGLAAALAVGVAVPVLHHSTDSQTPAAQTTPAAANIAPTVVAVAVPQTTVAETASAAPRLSPAQQISRDNQMLRAIDAELDLRTESPAALGLLPVTSVNPSVPSQMQD
jgi:hypothetical protein